MTTDTNCRWSGVWPSRWELGIVRCGIAAGSRSHHTRPSSLPMAAFGRFWVSDVGTQGHPLSLHVAMNVAAARPGPGTKTRRAFCLDTLPAMKPGDSCGAQAWHAAIPESLRWFLLLAAFRRRSLRRRTGLSRGHDGLGPALGELRGSVQCDCVLVPRARGNGHADQIPKRIHWADHENRALFRSAEVGKGERDQDHITGLEHRSTPRRQGYPPRIPGVESAA